jgi:hypothetical protein
MKVTTPQEKSSPSHQQVADAINQFEEKLQADEPGLDYYHLVILGELNYAVCKKIEDIYYSAGWMKVICKTSSQNGEPPGLTGLKLWMPDHVELL